MSDNAAIPENRASTERLNHMIAEFSAKTHYPKSLCIWQCYNAALRLNYKQASIARVEKMEEVPASLHRDFKPRVIFPGSAEAHFYPLPQQVAILRRVYANRKLTNVSDLHFVVSTTKAGLHYAE